MTVVLVSLHELDSAIASSLIKNRESSFFPGFDFLVRVLRPMTVGFIPFVSGGGGGGGGLATFFFVNDGDVVFVDSLDTLVVVLLRSSTLGVVVAEVVLFQVLTKKLGLLFLAGK